MNARNKGHAYERKIRLELIESGFYPECETSRYASKKMDDLKVDLVNTDPFQIQCKAVENLGSPHKILQSMPQTEGKINCVFHKKNRQGEVVSITKEDFYWMLEKLLSNNLITP